MPNRAARGAPHDPLAAMIRSVHALLALLPLAFSLPAAAAAAATPAELRILLPDGSPAVAAQVTIGGRAGSLRTDTSGRVSVGPLQPPVAVTVVGPRGEIYPPVQIEVVQSDQPTVVHLQPAFQESVTVTTGVAPNIDAPPAAPASTVTREELETNRPLSLAEAIESVAGVSRTGEGVTSVPIIRGLARGRTLVLIDDARVVTERRAGASAAFLNPFALSSVEVTRGPGSVAYGSDALGGVVHARTRDPVPGSSEFRWAVAATGHGAPLGSAGVELSGDVAGGSLMGQLHYRAADDMRAGGGEPIENSSFRSHGEALRFVRFGERDLLRIGLASDRSLDVGRPMADADLQRTRYPSESSDRLTLALDRFLPGAWSVLELRGSASAHSVSTERERFPTAGSPRQLASSRTSASDAAFRAKLSRQAERSRTEIGASAVSRFGVKASLRTHHFDSFDRPIRSDDEIAIADAARHDAGVYAVHHRPAGERLTISGGVRLDSIESESRDGYFGDRRSTDLAWAGHTAAVWQLHPELSAVVQIARGFRAPTLSDRYFRGISGRGFVTGNPDLEPERSVQFDSSLRWSRGANSLTVAGYQYRIDHLIERYRSGPDFLFRNRGRAEISGIELEGELRLPHDLTTIFSVTRGRGRAIDDRMPLDDIAPAQAQLTLRWDRGRTSTFGRAWAIAGDDRPGPTEVARPGHGRIDAGVGVRLTPELQLRLAIDNLLDEQYFASADALSPLAPGRSFGISLSGTRALRPRR
jgi:outer membrane receptor protein involved in Fe transport